MRRIIDECANCLHGIDYRAWVSTQSKSCTVRFSFPLKTTIFPRKCFKQFDYLCLSLSFCLPLFPSLSPILIRSHLVLILYFHSTVTINIILLSITILAFFFNVHVMYLKRLRSTFKWDVLFCICLILIIWIPYSQGRLYVWRRGLNLVNSTVNTVERMLCLFSEEQGWRFRYIEREGKQNTKNTKTLVYFNR